MAAGLHRLDVLPPAVFRPSSSDSSSRPRTCEEGPPEDWDSHHAKMAADHRADGAREELRVSWKAYVTEHVRGNGAESGSADFVCGVELGADD